MEVFNMKKKDFITLILSVVGGLLFALDMCMALVPEMGTITQGVVLGVIGLAVLLAMVIVRRKMDGKPAIVFNGRVIGITLYSILGSSPSKRKLLEGCLFSRSAILSVNCFSRIVFLS